MKLILVPTAALLACASLATADTTNLLYNGVTAGQVVTITSPGYNGQVNAGSMSVTLSGGTGAGAAFYGSWLVYCVDYYQTTNTGPNVYDFTSVASLPTSAPMGAAAAQAVADLYAAAGGLQYGGDGEFNCAFQLALWEVIGDAGGSYDLGVGNFAATGLTANTLAYAVSLLASVGSNSNANLIGLGNETYQDFVLEVPGPGALALIGVAGLVGARRRR